VRYVVSGRGRIIVGDDEMTVEPDTAVYVPTKTYTGDETFKGLWVFHRRVSNAPLLKKGGEA